MTADTVGGVFTWAVDLIGALRRHEVEVVLVTFGAPASADQRRRIRASGVTAWHESELAVEWMENPWADLRTAQRWLLKLEEQERPDVVHLSGYGHGAAGFHAPVVVTGHSCVFSWWQAVRGAEPPPAWQRYRRWVRDGLGGAAVVAAPTRTMLQALHRHYGDWPGEGRVIHNATTVAPAPAGLPKQPFVLTAGRLWDPAKNLPSLTEAAARLAPQSVRAAGELGDERAPTAVTLLGVLGADQLAVHRQAAAVFAAPARYEPFGLAVLEAARDRCALVLGDIASLRELWQGAAVFVDPDDPARLADELARLLADPRAVAELGELAVQRSLLFDTDTMASRHADLYRQVTAVGQELAVR